MSLLTPDFGLLFWMLLSFAIVFFLLAKFGFPIITKMVDERRKFISDSIAAADEANSKLANIQQESEALIQEAKARQSEMLKQASEESNRLVQAAKEQAIAETQRQMEDAKQQIEAQKQKAMGDIRAQVANLSVDIAEKILRLKLETTDNQESLIERLLDEVEHSEAIKN